MAITEELDSLLRQAIEEVRDNWLKENVKGLTQDVIDAIEKNKKSIIAQVLGFSDKWGKWEIDHCNGRNGNSFIGPLIQEKATEACATVVNEALKSWKPTAAMVAAIEKDMNEAFRWRARELAQEYARTRAREYVEKLAKDLIQ